MGKKINKGFVFYLLIFLGIILAAFAACVVIMIISPGLEIFGISYYKEGKSITTSDIAVYASEDATEYTSAKIHEKTVENIVINSNIHDILIYKTNSGQTDNTVFRVEAETSASGFTKTKIETSFSSKYYTDTKTWEITVTGPSGFLAFGNNSSVTIQIPETVTNDADISYKIDAGDGAVTFGDTFNETSNLSPSTLNIKSFDITAKKSITFTDYTNIGSTAVADCAVSTEADFSCPVVIRANNFDLTLGSGDVTLNEEGTAITTDGKITIESSYAHIYAGNIICASLEYKGEYGKFDAKDITGNFIVSEESVNSDFILNKINGQLSVGSLTANKLATRSNIEIKESVSGIVDIATTGTITIGEIDASTKIKTTTGKITIPVVKGTLEIESKGEVVLGAIENTNGTISSGVEAKVTVNLEENGSVKAYFNTILPSSTITAEKGKIETYIKCSEFYVSATTSGKIYYEGELQTSPLTILNGDGQNVWLQLNSTSGQIDIKRVTK